MKKNRTAILLACLFLVSAVLAGCNGMSSGTRTEKEYGKGETMVIVTSERLRYEDLYTDRIWSVAVDNRGTTFETVLLEQIHNFLRELKVMSLMAADEDLRLSAREKELVKEAAAKYYETLGGTDAARFGIDEKGLEAFYTDYWLSQKLVDYLTDGMNLEVSDSEAKVITALEIVTEDRVQAEEAMAAVDAGDTDFYSIAQEYSIDDDIEKQLMRGEHGDTYDEIVFILAEGEVSPIIEDDGEYHIVKCVDDYDESATRERKRLMTSEKKNDAFYEKYDPYRMEIELVGDDELWDGITISGSAKVTADFFGLFEKICEEQG